MAKNSDADKAKKQLGQAIAKCRGKDRSQRNLATAVGIPPSTMKYIEDGVNAPTHDVYAKIIIALTPDSRQRERMDKLYTLIRKTPPPDICETINQNQELLPVLRLLEGATLTKEQISRTKELFQSFADENRGD